MRRSWSVAWALGVMWVLASCQSGASGPAVSGVAEDFDGHDCAACSMIVREQSAPRGQVIHRDGTRLYFCSVSDMLTYLQAPSPHGKVAAMWVETLDPAADPVAFDVSRHPWMDATRASYVLGVEKPRVMGVPIVAYASPEDAQRVVSRSEGAKFVDWETLKASEGLQPR